VWRDPRRLLAAFLLLALGAALALGAGDGKAPKKPLYPSLFPAGAGKTLADTKCQICHSASLVTQQTKDSTGWEKTIGQMEKWGVQTTPAEHDSLRGYLLAHFGPGRK
jgi:cytochrome c5